MQRRLLNAVIGRLVRRAMRTPYSHLPGYMDRFWLVPYRNPDAGHGCGPVPFFKRPLVWLLQRLGVAIRIHHILRSDDARAFHDHPWWYCTILLRGGYTEVRPVYASGIYVGSTRRRHSAPAILFRRAQAWHRLEIDRGESAWTLFITGPYKNKWGFLVQPAYKQYWRDYVAQNKETGNG